MRTHNTLQWSSLCVSTSLFVALGFLLLHRIFLDFDYLGGKDWSGFMGQAQAELTTLRDYGQIPLWNPWRAGGQVSLAQPESMLLSPVTPLVMLFGVIPAFKLMILPVFVVGCLGMRALAGHLGLTGPARLVPALVFFGSSVFPLYVSGGIPTWLFGLALLPWLVLFNHRAVSDARFVVFGAATYAGVLFCGSIYHFVFFPLALGLHAVVVAVSMRSFRPLVITLTLLLMGVALAGVRLVPLLEVFREMPRLMPSAYRYLDWPVVARAFLGTELPDLFSLKGPWVASGGTRVYWINVGSYVGPVAVALASLGVILRTRASAGFAVIGAFFLWMALGSGADPSLWDALHALPVLGSMQAPARLIFLVTFALAMLAGWGFQAGDESTWVTKLSPAQHQGLRACVLLATTIPMLIVNAPIAATAFTVKPNLGVRLGGWFSPQHEHPAFQQTERVRHYAQWKADLLYSVVHNQGNILGPNDFRSDVRVRPSNAPGYRGEVYLRSGRGTVSAEVTPNVISVRADVKIPDVLVVNQVYFPGWRAEGELSGSLVPSQQGLLSLEVPPGRHEFTLHYRPRSLAPGVGLSVLTAATALLFLWRRRGAGGVGE